MSTPSTKSAAKSVSWLFEFTGNALVPRLKDRTRAVSEGSVQKDGNRVRITAELIEAAAGVCKWAERYNREFSDIFEVQEEIAHAIVAAMHVPLGLKDTAAYEIYLRARKLIRARGLANLTKASDLLEHVVSQTPNYPPAWAMLGFAYALTPNFHWAYFTSEAETLSDLVKNTIPCAEMAARKAVELDPEHEEAYVALALAEKFSEADISKPRWQSDGDCLIWSLLCQSTIG